MLESFPLSGVFVPAFNGAIPVEHGLSGVRNRPVRAPVNLGGVERCDLGDKQIILRQVFAAVDTDHWLGLINMILGIIIVALCVPHG